MFKHLKKVKKKKIKTLFKHFKKISWQIQIWEEMITTKHKILCLKKSRQIASCNPLHPSWGNEDVYQPQILS